MFKGESKWKGRIARAYEGSVEKIREWIPHFTRISGFGLVDEGVNKYLDIIVREPLENDAKYIKDRLKIPVCTVTKWYHLFQHRDVFEGCARALKKIIADSEVLKPTLVITEHGERMWCSFTLASFQLKEAYRYPMKLEVSALNTVVSGTALDIRLSWHEPESKARIPYGMLSGYKVNEVNLKKIARKKKTALDPSIFSEIHAFLERNVDQLSREREAYKSWREAKVNRELLARWIDKTVREEWGYDRAVRAYHLINNGTDVEVKRPNKEKNDEENLPVPSSLGAGPPTKKVYYITKDPASEIFNRFAPARDAFDISMVLAWMISKQTTVQAQLKWEDIPKLNGALGG